MTKPRQNVYVSESDGWISILINKPVFRIRPDQKLFGLKDPNPKLLILDPDPSIFTQNYKIYFEKSIESEQIHHDYTYNTWKI